MLGLVFVLAVGTASPSPAPSPAPTATPITARILVSPLELVTIIKAAYAFGGHAKPVIVVTKKLAEMPAGLPARYYVGMDPSGRPIFWNTDPHSITKADEKSITPDLWMNSMFAAGAMAAADSGTAGRHWKQMYDRAPDKAVLARAIIGQYQQMSDRISADSWRQIAWLHSALLNGMSRSQVYTLLKKHRLVAFNSDYNPGKATFDPRFPSCNYEATRAQSNWPRYKQPLPRQAGVCADLGHTRQYAISPSAYIDFVMGFNFACGKRLHTELRFDVHDKLSAIKDSKVEETCI